MDILVSEKFLDHSSFSFFCIIAFVCICLIGILFNDWRKKRSQPKVRYRTLPSRLGEQQTSLDLKKNGGRVFVCPQCYTIADQTGECPNEEHITPVVLEEGSVSQLEYYQDMQRLLSPEDSPNELF